MLQSQFDYRSPAKPIGLSEKKVLCYLLTEDTTWLAVMEASFISPAVSQQYKIFFVCVDVYSWQSS